MEGKRQIESVLAKLMGLERPPPSKLVVHSRRRVYSESYLQDIALISQQQKWSFDRFSMDVDDTMLDRRDSSEDMRSYSSSEESLQRYRAENEMFQKLWMLNSSDKGYSSRGSAYSQKSIESVSQTPIRSPLQNQTILSSNGGKTKPFSSMRRKGECLGKRERDCSSGREALKKGSTTTNSIAKQVADSLKHSVWHNYLKGSQKQDVLNTSLQAKINSKVGEQCISNSMSFPSSGSSIFKNKKINAHKDWCLDLMDWDSSYSSSWREVNCKSEEDLTMRNSPSFTSLHSEKDAFCEETPSTTTDSSELVGKDLLEEKNSDCVSPKEKCVKVDATSQQGAFELGCTVCPVAIKYNKVFVDAFWNSKKQSFTTHLLQLMTSWAVVCDVWYLEPQKLKDGENPIQFAERVRDMITARAGLKKVPWDGYLKYSRPSPKLTECTQQSFAESLLSRLEDEQ